MNLVCSVFPERLSALWKMAQLNFFENAIKLEENEKIKIDTHISTHAHVLSSIYNPYCS